MQIVDAVFDTSVSSAEDDSARGPVPTPGGKGKVTQGTPLHGTLRKPRLTFDMARHERALGRDSALPRHSMAALWTSDDDSPWREADRDQADEDEGRSVSLGDILLKADTTQSEIVDEGFEELEADVSH